MVYDLIIIGGGPAGITAGIYAARQKLNTLLITKSFGGQVTRKAVAIENYPGFKEISGAELIKKFTEHLKKFKIEILTDSVVKVRKINREFLIKTKGRKKLKSSAIIIASGADPRPLEVPGEKKFIGRGVSYCTTCDGPIFEEKTVAVIGGGNAGFEAAIFLAKYAKEIYVLESEDRVKADEINQERVKKIGKVKVITNAVLKKIKGNQFVNSIIYQDRKSKKINTLKVQGVFVEVGSQPATSFAKGLVDFNEKDEIKVEFETYQTKTLGLFAVGDCNVGQFKQIVTACGEGAKAALSAYNYLEK
jgi:thioredoxin-disulfide reductase